MPANIFFWLLNKIFYNLHHYCKIMYMKEEWKGNYEGDTEQFLLLQTEKNLSFPQLLNF